MLSCYGELPQEQRDGMREENILYARLALAGESLMGGDFPGSGARHMLSWPHPEAECAWDVWKFYRRRGLALTFFSGLYGMLEDPWGVQWMISIDAPKP